MQRREKAETSLQGARHEGNGDPVVRERHLLFFRLPHSGEHGIFRQHAAAAVDHQPVRCEVFRKTAAGAGFEDQLFSGMCLQPARDLDRSDVVALTVMGAALRHQDPVPVLQVFHCADPLHGGLQKAFVPGHQDRERGQRDLVRHQGADRPESLAVRDHQRGIDPRFLQDDLQLRVPADHRHRPPVHQVPDGLLLGQNQPALGGGLVHGTDQDTEIAGGDQVSRQLPLLLFRDHARQPFLQGLDPRPRQAADLRSSLRRGFCPGEICLVPCNKAGNLPLLDQDEQLPVRICKPFAGIGHQHRNVTGIQDLLRFLHTLPAQCSRVVKARGVNDDHGTQRQKLHRLLYRVGGGALHVGHHCQVLAGHRVDQAGLPGVPHAEKSDVRPFSGRCFIQTHVSSFFSKRKDRCTPDKGTAVP